MKNKYYAVLNGQEILVRESTHDNYNYASIECNTFASTREQVIARIKRDIFSGYNMTYKSYSARGYVQLWDSNRNEPVKLSREESKKYLQERYNILNEKFNDFVSKIVKVYIKVSA